MYYCITALKGKTVHIIIAGKIGEGKSTMAIVLQQALHDIGFQNITVKDEKLDMPLFMSTLDDKLQSIRETPIQIETKQQNGTGIIRVCTNGE